MFTVFLIVSSIGAFSFVYLSCFRCRESKEVEACLSTKIANIRSLKKIIEECEDGILVMEYHKKRESEIQTLCDYLESAKLKDVDNETASKVIELESYRGHQNL